MRQRAGAMSQSAAGHEWNSARRFECSKQDESVFASAFHKHIEQPIHPIIEIHVSGPGLVPCDEFTSAWTSPGVGGFVVGCGVRFGLDNNPRTSVPHE